ncbi:17230_t:CDS:2, partial [Gigaspora rosea]
KCIMLVYNNNFSMLQWDYKLHIAKEIMQGLAFLTSTAQKERCFACKPPKAQKERCSA